jgi:hypothetical protein
MSSNPECARTLEFWLSVMVNCAEPNPLCICLPTAKLSRMALRIRMQRSVWIKTIATSSNNAIPPKTPQVAGKRYPARNSALTSERCQSTSAVNECVWELLGVRL